MRAEKNLPAAPVIGKFAPWQTGNIVRAVHPPSQRWFGRSGSVQLGDANAAARHSSKPFQANSRKCVFRKSACAIKNFKTIGCNTSTRRDEASLRRNTTLNHSHVGKGLKCDRERFLGIHSTLSVRQHFSPRRPGTQPIIRTE